jgi:excinuclease ABC subunit C
MEDILITINQLPSTFGVYQYFDKSDRLLYIGKAKDLKKRVKSYFRFTPTIKPNPTQSTRILKMLSEAKRLEYIVVSSEEDALILENSLIKQLNPKYNILLRDDKTYPYIYIDESEPFPRFELTRRVVKGKNIKYYGPFPTGGKALLDAIYEIYPLVQKKSCLKEKRACLFHQIKKCHAPCEGKIGSLEYKKIIDEVKDAIVKRDKLISALNSRMYMLAESERFEEAAKIRDISSLIESLTLSNTTDLARDTNLDIFTIVNGEERGVVVKLFMRAGKIISSSYNYFRHTQNFDHNEAYKQALLEHYTVDSPHIVSTILVPESFEDSIEIASTLSLRFSKKVKIISPKRGPKAKLITLAIENAKELLKNQLSHNYIEQEIADLLDLTVIPYRIESFDNSHMMGVATVGAMVVWDEEKWDKKSYRRYELHQRDEYGQMREMLSRRIDDFDHRPPPDLWILDGGEANLNLALMLLKDAKVNLDVIAIAKEKLDAKAHRAKGAAKDIIYSTKGILELKQNDRRLHWIQKQRDESHRFAIAYHQNKKRKDDTKISLLNKKGIGKATVKKLIDYFGTFENIDKAEIDELAKVVGLSLSKKIKK